MKRIVMILLAGGMAGFLCVAQEAKPNSPASLLSAEERAQCTKLSQIEVELSAQLKLLQGLVEEHLKRSEDAARTATPERTKWENDLIQELRDRSAATLGQLNDTAKQRLALEAAHSSVPASATGAPEEGKHFNADEFTFLQKLDERLLKVRQELAASVDGAKNLYSELLTNNTAEAVGRVSRLLEENAKQTRLWEREQADLELKRLEFRALRK